MCISSDIVLQRKRTRSLRRVQNEEEAGTRAERTGDPRVRVQARQQILGNRVPGQRGAKASRAKLGVAKSPRGARQSEEHPTERAG